MKIKKAKYSVMVRIVIFIILPLILCLLIYNKIFIVLNSYMKYKVNENADLLGNMVSKCLDVQIEDMERVAEYSSVQNAFRGKSTVRYQKGKGFLFTVPVYIGINIKYALYEFFDEEQLFDSFENNCNRGQGQVVLVDSVQKKIVPISENVNDFDFISEDMQDVYIELNRKMGLNTSVAVFYENSGNQEFLFISELEQDNLYLLGKIPYSVVARNISFIALIIIMVYLLLILLAIGILNVVSANAKVKESDEIREAKCIAEEASKSKSKFIANMSHELRTPINVILGMDELILREEIGEETRKRALDIKSAAYILLGLINDVIDFSKIESGKMNSTLAEYDLVSILRDLTLLTENRARQKNISFELDIQPELPVGLYGDEIHIRQVMINLLTNAVKYTNEGQVTLKLSGTWKDDETIIIHCEVIDTGIGMKQEDIDKLMIPYTRIEEERNCDVKGTGLGMSIIINLLKLMGSKLNIRSIYGKGSIFYFDMEQKVVSPEPIGNIRKRMDDMIKDYNYKVSFIAPAARILMVDDNSMNRELFVSLLKDTQISVTTVSSGEKCLEIVQKEYFDIIFMDYLMPEMDGEETLRRLKVLKGNLCKDVPIIVLTANAFNGAGEKYMEIGFDDFLFKPISTEKLEAMIQKKLPNEYIKHVSQKELKGSKYSNKDDEDIELPKIEGVNWEYALLHMNNKKLLFNTLRKFYENIDKEYKEISVLYEEIETEEGLENYHIRIHALKSVSAMVGILSVSELAKFLEYAARTGERGNIYAVNFILLEELRKTKERLQPFMDQEKTKKLLIDNSKIVGLFDMLRFSMEQMDIAGADSVLEQIQNYSYKTEIQEYMNRLVEKVNALDYKGASEEIEYIIKILEKTKT